MLFGTPAKLPDGRYFLKLSQDDKSRVTLQLNNVTYSTNENTVTIAAPSSALTLFSDIDEQIVAQAKASKVEWFGKEVSDDTVTSAYQKSLNPESELSASFARVKGKVVTMFYDTQKTPVETIEPGTKVDVLIEIVGLIFLKRTFEPVWNVLQVRVRAEPKPKIPREYLFKDDPVDEEEEVDL
jgi:hypothetical protein